jgi:gamma-glutamyltranspeptidase/glutathione hydrolase
MKKMSVFISLILLSFNVFSQRQLSVKSKKGVVVTADKNASEVGVAIMKKGGNAVDAAVATAFALAVTHPFAGNIGGGGFMLIRLADGTSVSIDYREKAPAAATAEMFLDENGDVDTVSSQYGYLVAGVPGTIRGMEAAWKKYGKLKWHELLEPAIALAEKGFYLNDFEIEDMKRNEAGLKRYAETRKTFFKPDGSFYTINELFVQKDLTNTLRQIAKKGADEFYTGKLADQMVADFRQNGGILTKKDLQDYKPAIREVLKGNYRGYEIMTMGPPSSGTVLLEMLKTLENFQLEKNPQSPYNLHVLTETMRRAYFDRTRYMGDADFVKVPVNKLTSAAYTKELAATIGNTATRSDSLFKNVSFYKENMETTHFSVVDQEGNIVSNTYTIEEAYGSKAVVKGLGFLLNNEMHDFNIQPNKANFWGGIGDDPNRIQPGKRMLSSMTPTIVLKDGKPLLVTGSPGGRTIINTVLQMIIGVTDYQQTLKQTIDMPRITHHWMPDFLYIEKGRFSEAVIQDLVKRGHIIRELESIGRANSIYVDPATGEYYGEADWRKGGWAAGY